MNFIVFFPDTVFERGTSEMVSQRGAERVQIQDQLVILRQLSHTVS